MIDMRHSKQYIENQLLEEEWAPLAAMFKKTRESRTVAASAMESIPNLNSSLMSKSFCMR